MGEIFAGRYELVDVLDRGGMGTVWRVWDLRDRTYRAAKMLRQSDSASLLRFVRETGTRIDHPHVVAPTGWSAEDDRVLFAMPLVGGGSVATLLADYGALPAHLVRVLMLQLLDALTAVHAAGIVHRDLKPANLLLEPTGTGEPVLRLSDFGIAASPDEPRLTRANDVVHTPGYSAPGVVAGADPDPLHDLYSVGMVMRELLTGDRPGPDARPLHAPGGLSGIQERLVSTDPDHRLTTAAEAYAALSAVVVAPDDGEPVEVFDQLPPLPDGWDADGPVTGRVRGNRSDQRLIDPAVRLRALAGLLALVGLTLLVTALLVGF